MEGKMQDLWKRLRGGKKAPGGAVDEAGSDVHEGVRASCIEVLDRVAGILTRERDGFLRASVSYERGNVNDKKKFKELRGALDSAMYTVEVCIMDYPPFEAFIRGMQPQDRVLLEPLEAAARQAISLLYTLHSEIGGIKEKAVKLIEVVQNIEHIKFVPANKAVKDIEFIKFVPANKAVKGVADRLQEAVLKIACIKCSL